MAHSAYIVSTDYTNTYKGTPIATASFDRIALRASEIIDQMTMFQVRREGLTTFDTDVQEAIKLATCAIAEGLGQIDDITEGQGVLVSSEKVGSYAYTLDPAAVSQALLDAGERASGLLLYSGLLYRGM